jgi:hypothetical protein
VILPVQAIRFTSTRPVCSLLHFDLDDLVQIFHTAYDSLITTYDKHPAAFKIEPNHGQVRPPVEERNDLRRARLSQLKQNQVGLKKLKLFADGSTRYPNDSGHSPLSQAAGYAVHQDGIAQDDDTGFPAHGSLLHVRHLPFIF